MSQTLFRLTDPQNEDPKAIAILKWINSDVNRSKLEALAEGRATIVIFDDEDISFPEALGRITDFLGDPRRVDRLADPRRLG